VLTLGIETSCDETSVAVYDPSRGVLSNAVFSQIDLHKAFGGVMPEMASRSQLERIAPVMRSALSDAAVTLEDITTIALTTGPGLPGSLLVGLCFGKAIAWARGKRLIGVDHHEGHAYSSFLENDVPFPHLCLTASGGHTSIHLIRGFGDYHTVSHTLDDAAGEAFDKIAKLLGLPYPGGPVIEQYARRVGFEDFFSYPRGKPEMLNFSFSGLKTAVLYDLVDRGAYDMKHRILLDSSELLKQQVASSLLVCVAAIFARKLRLALAEYPEAKAVTFVGGVACNRYIRRMLQSMCDDRGIRFFVPSPQYCTDNAAMIAFVGNYRAERGEVAGWNLDIF